MAEKDIPQKDIPLEELLKSTGTMRDAMEKLADAGFKMVQILEISGFQPKSFSNPQQDYMLVDDSGRVGLHPYGSKVLYVPKKGQSTTPEGFGRLSPA